MKISPGIRVAALVLPLIVGRAAADPGDVAPAQPVVPARAFNLKDFGAVPDGKTPNTDVFKKAFAAVTAAGGGTLEVPAGTYFTGPLNLCSNLNLHLDAGATILFSPVFDDYATGTPDKPQYRPLLLIKKAHDVVISGDGTINGNGAAWWPEAWRFKKAAWARHSSQDTSPRPKMVVSEHCQRLRFEGITLTNSPVMNLMPTTSDDVTIEGVKVVNPGDSPNTDGIDPSCCHRVLISHCTVDTGDDNIAVKAGTKGVGGEDDPGCTDLLITDCTFLHGHGCSIGSETFSCLSNMTVRRCTFDGTFAGIRLKSDRKRGGLVENLTYSDLTMKDVGQAISISSYYMGTTTDTAGIGLDTKPVTATTPHWKGITIRNVTASGGTMGAGIIIGLPEMPVDTIVLDNVSIAAPKGLRLINADGVTLHNVHVRADSGEGILTDGSVKNIQSDGK